MDIKSELESLWQALQPSGATLVAVSKTHPADAVAEAYAAGQRVFGESTAQELCAKYEILPKDIIWHFIGHLQRNKVKYIAPFVHMVHAVDTPKLLREIHKEGEKNGRQIDCLLQVHIALEETKYGFSAAELREYLAAGEWRQAPNARICGLMAIATNTPDETRVQAEFAGMKSLFDALKTEHFADADHFKELSMGMSADFPLALAHGATLIRVGSRIFGHRDYSE